MRYQIFGGDYGYITGGAGDWIDQFEKKKQARKLVKQLLDEACIEWYQIWDTKKCEMVAEDGTKGAV